MKYNTIVLLNELAPVYPSGNIPVIRIDNVINEREVKIIITRDDTQTITIIEKYQPVEGNYILVAMRDLVHRFLKNNIDDTPWNLPDPGARQLLAVAQVQIQTPNPLIEGDDNFTTIKSFMAVKAETHHERFTAGKAFFNANMLSVQPQERNVTNNETIFLSAYITQNSQLTARCLTSGLNWLTQNLQSITGSNDSLWNFYLSWDTIEEQFTFTSGETPLFFDIYMTHASGQKTLPIRFFKREFTPMNYQVFAFVNTLGGLETIPMTGETTRNSKNQYLKSEVYNTIEEYETIPAISFSKKIIAVESDHEKLWVADFFDAEIRYAIIDGEFIPVWLEEYSLPQTQDELDSYEFTYAMRKQTVGKNPYRKTTIPYIVIND